ncbi:Hypothetical predicted protein [Octopus vulgaris]|uniref:Uncharacterized protein n=1 Tax=Octopus vulgaris TaxID=6645 RepID=A0AA36BHK7_OCTVU|nr:Hypothetical predicted protein [Octopus vulgaris]
MRTHTHTHTHTPSSKPQYVRVVNHLYCSAPSDQQQQQSIVLLLLLLLLYILKVHFFKIDLNIYDLPPPLIDLLAFLHCLWFTFYQFCGKSLHSPSTLAPHINSLLAPRLHVSCSLCAYICAV